MNQIRRFEFDQRFDLEELSGDEQEAQLAEEIANQEEADRLEAEHEAIRAIARADGFQAGLEFARTERESEMLRLGSVLGASLERSFSQAMVIQGQITLDAIGLAVAIGEGLAGELLKKSPLACAEQAIASALAEQFERPRLTVKVSPKDLDAMKDFVAGQVDLVAYEGRMIVQADPELISGDCVIEWSDGGIRSIMSERKQRVIGQLVEMLNAAPAEECAETARDQRAEAA